MSKKQELILQGFFIELDKYDRAKIMFIDNYELPSYSGVQEKMGFTKSYILNRSKNDDYKNPLTPDKTCFYVQCGKNKVGFINDKPVPLDKLKQHKVTLYVTIQPYKFSGNYGLVQGWSINLNKIDLLEM